MLLIMKGFLTSTTSLNMRVSVHEHTQQVLTESNFGAQPLHPITVTASPLSTDSTIAAADYITALMRMFGAIVSINNPVQHKPTAMATPGKVTVGANKRQRSSQLQHTCERHP